MGDYAPARQQVEVAMNESGIKKQMESMSDAELLAIVGSLGLEHLKHLFAGLAPLSIRTFF